MRHLQEIEAAPAAQLPSGEWARLILKLRWMGLEDETHSLELAMSKLPAEERGSVLAGPLSTD
jgi:hypothetical protein